AHLQERPELYSRLRLWGSVGFIVSVVGLGYLLQWLPLRHYPWLLLLIMAGILLASLWVPDVRQTVAAARAASGLLPQLRAPGVLLFYLAVALMQLYHGPYYTFISRYLEGLGYSRGLIGQLWALGVVAEILLFLAMLPILARVTLRQLLLL